MMKRGDFDVKHGAGESVITTVIFLKDYFRCNRLRLFIITHVHVRFN